MTQTKPWYLSKTIWAAVVSVAATIGAMFGFSIDDGVRDGLVEVILQLIAAGSALFSIFGRITATTKLN